MTENLKRIKQMYRTAVAESLPNELSIIIGEQKLAYTKMSWPIPQEDGSVKNVGLRYGTNPHQKAALYRMKNPIAHFMGQMQIIKSGKGGLSATNIEDGYRALRLSSYFQGPTIVEMKHTNPSGVATSDEHHSKLADVFLDSWATDPRSSYGCTLGTNSVVDDETAEVMIQEDGNGVKFFIECLFAPGFTDKAVELLSRKKERRIVAVPNVESIFSTGIPYEIKIIGDTVLVEDAYSTSITSVAEMKSRPVVTKRTPTEKEYQQLTYAWFGCAEKRSNGIVIWKGNKALAFAVGQQERVGSVDLALEKAERYHGDISGSVLASDGFMLKDNAQKPIEKGITAFVQPGGGAKDDDVIRACDDSGRSMIFTGERAFRHF
jgi:phosphoribosylaminoimidazolecarboxamide formyltransferase/IMP cyclohydrolase